MLDSLFASLREVNTASVFLRMFLAVLIGAGLGLERERKNRPAGFRTHILVSLGAAVVMMTNQYAFQYFSVADPVRMGAQVISGIGFLGAGTILVTGKNQVKGMTTAAGLWATACCGLAVGIGFYEGAIIGSVFILIVMSGLNKIDQLISTKSHYFEFYVEIDKGFPLSSFLSYARARNVDIGEIQMEKNKLLSEAYLSVIFTAHSKAKMQKNDVLEILSQAQGVNFIEEL